MNAILDGCQDGLNILDDLKEKKEEMERMGNGGAESELGMNDTRSLTEGNKGSEGILGSTRRMNEADSSSDSPERASDDTYSIGSFFSDLQSFGSDAAEILEESKKFFTKLGAVVAIIGTCITTAGSLMDAIRDEKVKTAIFAGILLIGIQIPTTLAMLFVFLKEWVKATITGFFKAKKELEELVSDLESFADDTETEEKVEKLEGAPTNAKEKRDLETDELKRDLEKTKRKNNYSSVENLQKSDSIDLSPKIAHAMEKSPFGLINGQSIITMEEGENVFEKPRIDQKRQLPETPSSKRDRTIPRESKQMTSRPVQTSSGYAHGISRPSNASSKPMKSTEKSAPKNHRDTSSKYRSGPHRSSSRVSSTQRRLPASSSRSDAPSFKRLDSRREKLGNPSFKQTEFAGDRKSYGSSRQTSNVPRSQKTRSKNATRTNSTNSKGASKIRMKKTNQATQTMQKVGCNESDPVFVINGLEKMNELIEEDPQKNIERTVKCWRWFWNKRPKK